LRTLSRSSPSTTTRCNSLTRTWEGGGVTLSGGGDGVLRRQVPTDLAFIEMQLCDPPKNDKKEKGSASDADIVAVDWVSAPPNPTSKHKFRNPQSSATNASQMLPWSETDAMDGIRMAGRRGHAHASMAQKKCRA
jgi:hypothetical protein